jgi:hypothetical protein
MQSIDKNDVDISKLFKWKKDINILDDNGDIIKKVYMRIVGDAEINRARVFALRRSAELRKKLHTPDSDEALAFLPDIDLVEKEVFIENILLYWTKEFTQDAIRELKFNLPSEPHSEATLEEQERHQQLIDEWPENRTNAIRDYVTSRIELKREEINQATKEHIYREYIKLTINRLCEEEMVRKYREMCAYFSLYSDPSYQKHLFESYDDFDNLSSDLKSTLVSEYLDLELDGEELKKSPEAEQ